jgi:hypothetical protein
MFLSIGSSIFGLVSGILFFVNFVEDDSHNDHKDPNHYILYRFFLVPIFIFFCTLACKWAIARNLYEKFSQPDLFLANFLPNLMIGFMLSLNIGLHGWHLLSSIHIFTWVAWSFEVYVDIASKNFVSTCQSTTLAGVIFSFFTYLVFLGTYVLEILLVHFFTETK